MDLHQLRDGIDDIDSEILSLFMKNEWTYAVEWQSTRKYMICPYSREAGSNRSSTG